MSGGRLAADGPLPLRYHLTEPHSPGYRQRTRANVRDSDGTLLIYRDEPLGGTLLTQTFVIKAQKPGFLWSLDGSPSGQRTAWLDWLQQQQIRILNVAGPSKLRQPGIYADARPLLLRLCSAQDV